MILTLELINWCHYQLKVWQVTFFLTQFVFISFLKELHWCPDLILKCNISQIFSLILSSLKGWFAYFANQELISPRFLFQFWIFLAIFGSVFLVKRLNHRIVVARAVLLIYSSPFLNIILQCFCIMQACLSLRPFLQSPLTTSVSLFTDHRLSTSDTDFLPQISSNLSKDSLIISL